MTRRRGRPAQKVSVEIETASIDTGHAERDKHLRSPGFLNVKKFPKASFVGTGYEGGPEGGTMKGNLTLMGVTKPIAIAVKKVGEGDDPWGGYRAGFEGTVTIDRRGFQRRPHAGTRLRVDGFLPVPRRDTPVGAAQAPPCGGTGATVTAWSP